MPASTTITATAQDSPVLTTPTDTSTPLTEQPAVDPLPVFGGLTGMSFADLAKSPSTAASTNSNDAPFSSGGLSFATLAQTTSSNGAPAFGRPAGGDFIGLSTRDTFSNLMRPTNAVNGTSNEHNTSAGNENNENEDANYDPHYDPIIALPDEVQVSTGEENEVKLFGERAKLFRYDFDNKEVRKPQTNRFSLCLSKKINANF